MKQLYTSQKKLTDRLLAAPMPLRRTIVGGTGVGKTGMSISTATALKSRRILVVCPAIVRYTWAAEFASWANRIDVGIIEMGRSRKSGTKKALLARDWAYTQNIQIVSYDLVKELSPTGWDMVIIDECHNLGEPLSKQSRLAGILRAQNPDAHWLLLSATPIPTNAKQVWYPQWLLHGDQQWGKPAPNGGISWSFARRFLEIIKNEYGSSIGGLRAEKRLELQELVGSGAEFITRADISADLPPLDVRALYTPKVDQQFYEEWLELPEDITHACILVYNLDEAAMVRALVRDRPVFYVDGSISAGDRHRILAEAEAADRCVLVGTQGALAEGIRLMWVQKALITQWRRSPGQVTQLFGRFQSVGDARRPMLEVAIDDNADGYAELLLDRVRDINGILANNAVPDVVAQVFAPRELTDDMIDNRLVRMLGTYNDNKSDWDSDDDESEF